MSSDPETQKMVLRPFTRRGLATADGLLGGTTIVSLWDPAVPEGLFEADDYWNEAQILVLNGAMANQVREITDYVQATGVITVAPRFVNPAVSLLTVNSPIADVVIDVADASVFSDSGSLLAVNAAAAAAALVVADVSNLRAGAAVISDDLGASEAILILAVVPATNLLVLAAGLGAAYLVANGAAVSMAAAYIWDDAPNAEAVVIIGIDEVANQLTIAAPGLVAGYTVAANAAISMSPMILDTVAFVIMPPGTFVVAPGTVFDVSDRAARLLGIVYGENAQLQQLTPADALAPNESLEMTGFNMVYDVNADDWNRWREGAQIGVPMVEDTGLNTNPRRYEKDNGFRSPVVARAGGVATALWTIATAPARTAGEETTIYTIEIENATGAAITAWLEIAGVAITVPFHVADNDTVVIDYVAGFETGNFDINCNATANGVNFTLRGTEA